MTATDELRRLLDERGVKWTRSCYSGMRYLENTMWPIVSSNLIKFTEYSDGQTKLIIENATPEQAIAATLGNEACEWQGSVGQGWCQGAYDETVDEYDGFFTTWHILGCGHGVLMADDEKPSYCPNCGAKVVEQ